MSNRLANETSPYLRQHADNPVDWYPWGDEAFEAARREDKPILLSIGYSSCHWCHVMAHESFEDPGVARIMNEHFVSIKVDREERPDVDAIYMDAVQAMTGHGGWPMTVAMTADGEPFFGGTYFPPRDRWGRPSFERVLLSLADTWQNRRDEVEANAREIGANLQRIAGLQAEGGEIDPHVFTEAFASFGAIYDPRFGGFGSAPKFPPHTALKYLLARPEEGAQRMAHTTLQAMARGGIFDQLGGGFARYSVDEQWLVPHFEKMLYDNGQLLSRYAEAYARRPGPLYERVLTQTVAWLEREMSAPDGGFYSAMDADSEGEEGKFYVWRAGEFDELLGEDAGLARAYFGVSPEGNFEEGTNVLTAADDPEALAGSFRLVPMELASRVEEIRRKLFEARSERVRPELDDKILTSWNGLVIAGLADAGRVLGRPAFITRAARAAEFLRSELYQNGRLCHVYGAGGARVAGLLEDYTYLASGLLSLYRATFDRTWLLWALDLAEEIRQHFVDPEGGFFTTPDDGERLVVRPKDVFDGATPSGSGSTAELFMRLARLTGDGKFEQAAMDAIHPFLRGPKQEAVGFSSVLMTLEWILTPPREIAILGPSEREETQGLLRVVRERWLPYTVAAHIEGADDDLAERLAFLQGKGFVEGKPAAYVCEGGACRRPVTTPRELGKQVDAQLLGQGR